MFRLPWRRAANVAELVYALDLGSSGETHGSSSLPIRTIFFSRRELDRIDRVLGVPIMNQYDGLLVRQVDG